MTSMCPYAPIGNVVALLCRRDAQRGHRVEGGAHAPRAVVGADAYQGALGVAV
jgi:hypothetical protein